MSDELLQVQNITVNHVQFGERRSPIDETVLECELFVAFATWEERGSALAERGRVRCSRAIIAYFNPSHAPTEDIGAARERIRSGLGLPDDHVDEIALHRSVDFLESLSLLAAAVESACTGMGTVRVGIDISSLPIGYVQGLVSRLIQKGITPHVDCYYVEPVYGDPPAAPLTKFTTGSWRLVGVPYLEGEPTGLSDRAIIVCVGAESGSTRELLLGREYTDVAIIRPDAGRPTKWSEQIGRDCDELVSSLNVVGNACYNATPFSAVGVARYFKTDVMPYWRSNQRIFVAIGTKPHGLAGVLCNLIDPSISVFARVPGSYLVRAADAGSHVWKYSFRDLSSAAWATTLEHDWL